MQVVLGVAIGVVLIFVIVSIIKKIMKSVIVGSAVLVALTIGGYFFLFGDGSVSQEYLPQQTHENLQNIRSDARDKVENKTDEIKNRAMNKMQQSTKEMSEKINTTVQESVQKGVDAAINNLKVRQRILSRVNLQKKKR